MARASSSPGPLFDKRLDQIVNAKVRPVGIGVAVLILIGAWLRPLLLWDIPAGVFVMPMILTWVALIVFIVAFSSPFLPQSWSHAWIFIIAMLVFAVIGFGVIFRGASPWDIAYWPLAMVSIGTIQVTTRWFTATVIGGWVIILASWAASGNWWEDPIEVVGWIVTTVLATGLAIAGLGMQRTFAWNLLTSWQQDGIQNTIDELTGAYNRQGLLQAGRILVDQARDQQMNITVATCKVNGLTQANFEQGHLAGDAILRSVATAMKQAVDAKDLVGRWGNNEFVAITLGDATKDNLEAKVQQFISRFPPLATGWRPQLTYGLYTITPTDSDDLLDYIHQAEFVRAGLTSPPTV